MIRTKMLGTFKGWTGSTVVKLANGQVWQQIDASYHNRYVHSPDVAIQAYNFGYQMIVAGVATPVQVKRLR
jgi:hypothetical protein